MADGLSVGTLSMALDMDTGQLRKSMADVDSSMKKTADSAEKSGKKSSESWLSVGKALGGIALGAFAGESIKAFSEAQQVTVDLTESFARMPKMADSSAESIDKISLALSNNSRFSENAVKSGATVLANFGLTGKAVEGALPTLVDYAAKTGKDIPDAAKALTKAAGGSAKVLKELGLSGFKPTGDKAADFAHALELVGSRTSGFAATDVTTVEGGLARMNNSFETIKESIGGALMPAIESITPAISGMAGVAQKGATAFGELPGPLRAAALAIAGIVAVAKIGVFSKLTTGLSGFRTSFSSFRTGNAAVGEMSTGMGRFGAAASAAGKSLGGVGKNIMSAFGGPIGLALVGITLAIGFFAAANEKSKAKVQEHDDAVAKLAETMNQVTGAVTEASTSVLFDSLSKSADAYKAAGSSQGAMTTAVQEGGTALDAAKAKLIAYSEAQHGNGLATSQAATYIKQWSDTFHQSSTAVQTAAIAGGKAEEAMLAKFAKAGASGAQIDSLRGHMDDYRGAAEKNVAGLADLDAAQIRVGESADVVRTKFVGMEQAAAAAVHIDPTSLLTGLDKAEKKGTTAEAALKALGVTGARAKTVMDTLKLPTGGADGFHYMTQAAADAADALDHTGAAAEAVRAKALGTATPLSDMKVKLDGIASAASDADTASQYLQATLDRLAGRSQSATDALRLEQASIRGIGSAARDEAAAKDDVTAKSIALSEAREKAGAPGRADEANSAAVTKAEHGEAAAKDKVTAAQLNLTKAKNQGVNKTHSEAGNAVAVTKAEDALTAAHDKVASATITLAKAKDKAGKTDHSAEKDVLALRAAQRDYAESLKTVADKQDAFNVANETAKTSIEQQVSAVVQAKLAHGDLAGAVAAGTAKMQALRDAFIAAQPAADQASGKAAKLADKLGLIPKNVKTSITVVDKTAVAAAAAKKKLDAIRDKAIAIKAADQTAPGVRTAKGRIGTIEDRVAKLTATDKTNPGVRTAKGKIGSIKDWAAKVFVTDKTAAGVGSAKKNVASVPDKRANITAADQTGGGVGSAKAGVGSVPNKDAKITATNNTGAGVASAIQQLASVPAHTNAGLTITTNYVSLGTQPAPGLLGRVGVQVPKALGGALTGGVAGKDSIPILGMPGEHMLTVQDVAKLGGQAGVYRFRQALEAGKVDKYAAGGSVPSGAALAGTPAFQPGDVEGNTRGALGDLGSAVADFAAAAADARTAAGEAKGKLGEAKGSQHSTAVDQAGKVAGVRAADNAKLLAAEHALNAARVKAGAAASAAAARNAAAIAKAENALTAARAKGHKSAAETASRSAAITRAEQSLAAARNRSSGPGSAGVVKAEQHLAAVRTANAAALAKATAAQHKANAAQNAAVHSATVLAAATARTAALASARVNAEARTQAAETANRNTLIGLGRAYDANVVKIGGLQTALDDLNSKAADVTSGIAGNVQGIGGGILGSDAFTGSATTVSDMITSLQQNLDTAKGFDANIAKLVASGLNPAQAEKVANADPTGRGGVVATALAGASKAQIATINALLAQESAVGTTTGGRVATAEYGAEIHTTSVQIAAANLNMKIEAAEAAKIGATIAAATRAAMTGQHVQITVGAAQLNGIIAAVVKTEHSAEVRAAAGRR